MHLVWMVLAMWAFPCLMAACGKRKFGESLAVGLGIMMAALYLFALCGALLPGVYVLCALLVFCYGASAVCLVRKKVAVRDFVRRFLSPGFAVHVLLLLLLYGWTRDTQPALWDEMRLWAAYPKALYLTDQLQLGAHSVIFEEMQNYFPGLMLLQYFFQKLGAAWQEEWLYMVHFTLAFSFLLPAAEKGEKARWGWTAVYAAGCFLLPMTFFNSSVGLGDYGRIYQTLVCDIPLALCFAFSLYTAFGSVEESDQRWATAQYVLSLVMLMLIKESGLLLSMFSLALLLVFRLIRSRRAGDVRRHLWMVLLGFICAMLVKCTWSLELNGHRVEATGSWITGNLWHQLFHMTQGQLLALEDAFEHLKGAPLMEGVLGTVPYSTWAHLMLLGAVIIAVLLLCIRREKRRDAGVLLIGAYVINCVYALSLIIMFVFAWEQVLSYIRYISTMMLSCLAVLSMLAYGLLMEGGFKKSRTAAVFAGVLAACSLLALPFVRQAEPAYVTRAENHRIRQEAQITGCISDGGGFKNLYSANLATPDTDLAHQQLYYYLLDHGIAIRNMYQDGRELEGGFASDDERNDYLLQLFFNRPFGQYEYFYLDSLIDQRNIGEYASFFEGGESALKDGGVYSIQLDENTHRVHFVPCGM